MKIIPYTSDRLQEIQNMIEDPYVIENISDRLEEFSDCAMLAAVENTIIGVAVYTGKEKIVSFSLYIAPSQRRQGIGTKLLKALEDHMRESSVKEIYCDFKEDPGISTFMESNGYPLVFQSTLMALNQAPASQPDERIRFFKEGDYDTVHDTLHRAFQKMRREVGIPLKESTKSIEEAEKYLKNKNSILVLEVDSAVKGCLFLDGNEIDKLAVAPEEEKKGYGKTLLSAGLEAVFKKHQEATLWVVKGNPAEKLYANFGFQKIRLHSFHKKIFQ